MFVPVVGMVAVCWACLWPTDAPQGHVRGLAIDPQPLIDTGLPPVADNFTWQNHPNHNHGTMAELRTGVGSVGRAFFRWDQQPIANAVGGGVLMGARLDLAVTASSSWGAGGGRLGVYRVTKGWTELESTANCAVDADLNNGVPDCSGETAWVLNDRAVAPWVGAATDSIVMTDGQTGTISFDVKADVQAFLTGTANFGWVVKPVLDSAAADVRLYSREGATSPVLVLTIDADTSRPLVPAGIAVPPDSSALLVTHPDYPSVLYFRNMVAILFDDTTSGRTIRTILQRYSATIIGGSLETYIVEIPDPGTTLAALDSVIAALDVEPGVKYVLRVDRRERTVPRGRYPEDGPGSSREDWFAASPGPEVASRLAIRAPLAWGCEAGIYGGTEVRIGVLDYMFDADHFDLPAYRRLSTGWTPGGWAICCRATAPCIRGSDRSQASPRSEFSGFVRYYK